MRQHSKSRAMAILALAAVGVYSLCCKPAWSPKGDEVAYVFSSEANQESWWGVAVYNLETKQSRIVVPQAPADESPVGPTEVFWPERGHELIVVSAPEEAKKEAVVRVSSYDVRTSALEELQELAMPNVSVGASLVPMHLQRDRWLWVSAEEGCYRGDLEKGTVVRLKEAELFLRQGNKFFYVAEGAEGELVFGRIKTLFGLKEKPLFTVTVPHTEDEELLPVLAMPKKKTWFGYVIQSEQASRLCLLDKKGVVVKELPLTGVSDFQGGAEWRPDGSALWLVAEGADDAGRKRGGIVEVNLDTQTVRFITPPGNAETGFPGPVQVSLSPTGESLAISTMNDEEEAGLCIIDLTNDTRPVTIMPPPQTPTPVAQAEAG